MGFLESLATGLQDDDDRHTKTGGKLSVMQMTQFAQASMAIVAKMGLPRLIESFKKVGLEEAVLSWIGKGKNMPISRDQVQSALGPKVISELAKKVGIDATSAAAALSKLLPKVVDGLTPDGKEDRNKIKEAATSFDLGEVGSLLGGLLGK